MNAFAWSGLLTGLTCVGVIILIVACSPQPLPRLNRLMAIFNVFVGLWGFGVFWIGIAPTPEIALWAWRVAHIGPPLLGAVFYHLARVLCDRPGRAPVLWNYVFAATFVAACLSGVAVRDTRWMFNSLHYYKMTWTYFVYITIWIGFVIQGHRYLFLGYRTSTGQRRRHLKFVFYAMAIGFLGGTSSIIPGFGIRWYPYGNFTIPFYSLIITYAILRHQLIEVRVAITRTGLLLVTYLVVLGGPVALSVWGRAWLHALLGEYWWGIPLGLSTALATVGPFAYAFLRRQADLLLLSELAQSKAEASTDALTGVWARRHVLRLAQAELARSIKYGEPYSLLMIDLDHFKETNDTHGHLAGDAVLREVAVRLQGGLRVADVLGRYGGEEFVVILTQTPRAQALVIAERLRARVAERPIPTEAGLLPQTLSIGLASFPEDGAALETLIAKADAALYAAKREGRNRVEVAG